jgi:hypothetical protein
MRLAIEHATQRLTATARTEPLLRHAWANREHHIAARPLTGTPDKIHLRRGWALALAWLRRLQLRRFLDNLFFDLAQQRFPACRPLLPLPLPITPCLLPATRLARFAGPVCAATLPATPVPGALPTCFATVALLGIARPERLLAPLQETTPLPMGKS